MAEAYISGMRELNQALSRVDRGLKRELQGRLKNIAEVAAGAARTIAHQKGLEDDRPPPRGGLIDTIKPFASARSAGVRVTAKRPSPKYPSGYPYPKRLEYAGHEFLRPAVKETAAYRARELEKVFDWIETTFARGI